MVAGGAFERLDLERDPVDRDDAHRRAGGDRRRPVRARPPRARRRPSRHRRGRRRRPPRRARRSSTPGRSSAWRSGCAPSTACRRRTPARAADAGEQGDPRRPQRRAGQRLEQPEAPDDRADDRRRRSRTVGSPTWTSTAKANIEAMIKPTAQPRAGSAARPVHASTRAPAPTTPAMPTPAVKNSKTSRASPTSNSR